MKLNSFISLFLLLLLTSCYGQTKQDNESSNTNVSVIETIDVNSFEEKLKKEKKPQLIDVRTPQEYSTEKINDAQNINIAAVDFNSKVNQLDKNKPVFVYCKVGGRSAQAALKLKELGFKKIYNLDGGIMKWNASGKSKPITNAPTGMTYEAFQKLTSSDKKVLVNFNAVWCAPCKKMKPYLTKLQEELKDKVKIIRLDADENKTLVERMKLDGVPVVILYENGIETWRNTGYISEEDLKKHL